MVFWGVYAAGTVRVADFGAVPDDGKCDMESIHRAIQTAIGENRRTVVFEAGVYQLTETVAIAKKGDHHYIGIFDAENLTLIGQTDRSGRPITRLERTVKLDNETKPHIQINIEHSRRITVKNFILTNNPPLGSTARVISVDRDKDEVVVEVLEGLPAYHGMRCASAHAWDLKSGKLRRFGRTPREATLTIGGPINIFWQAVPGSAAIHILHAMDVDIRDNVFEGFRKKVEIDEMSTRNIRLDEATISK